MSRAVVLLSGGLDSYTAAAVAQRDGFLLSALSINYGQRHARELDASRAVAAALGVERHLELALDLSQIGGSSLTSSAIDVPKDSTFAKATADKPPDAELPQRVAGARRSWVTDSFHSVRVLSSKLLVVLSRPR